MLTVKKDNKFDNYQTEFLKACDDKEKLQLLIKEIKDAAKIICEPYFITSQHYQALQLIYDFDAHCFHAISSLPTTKQYKYNHSYIYGKDIYIVDEGNAKTKLMSQLLDIAKDTTNESQIYNEIDKVNGFDKLAKYLISNLKRTYTYKYKKIVLRHNAMDLTEGFIIDTFCGTARADILAEMWNSKNEDMIDTSSIYLSSTERAAFKIKYDERMKLNTNEEIFSPENTVQELVCAACVQGLGGFAVNLEDIEYTLQIPDELSKIQKWINIFVNHNKWNDVVTQYTSYTDTYYQHLFENFKQYNDKQSQNEAILFCVLNNLLRANKNHNASSILPTTKIVNFDAFIQLCKDINNFHWTIIPQENINELHQMLSSIVIDYLKNIDTVAYNTKIKQLLSVFTIDNTPLVILDDGYFVPDLSSDPAHQMSIGLTDSDALYHYIKCTGKQFAQCIFSKLGRLGYQKLNLTILSILHFKLTDITAKDFSSLAHSISLMFDDSDKLLSTLNKMYTSGNIVLKDDKHEDITLF